MTLGFARFEDHSTAPQQRAFCVEGAVKVRKASERRRGVN